MDNSKREKRGSINLSKFVGLYPNAKVGSKDHSFALETEDRKYILRAPDAVTKNIWIAKLCELCGQGESVAIEVSGSIVSGRNLNAFNTLKEWLGSPLPSQITLEDWHPGF